MENGHFHIFSLRPLFTYVKQKCGTKQNDNCQCVGARINSLCSRFRNDSLTSMYNYTPNASRNWLCTLYCTWNVKFVCAGPTKAFRWNLRLAQILADKRCEMALVKQSKIQFSYLHYALYVYARHFQYSQTTSYRHIFQLSISYVQRLCSSPISDTEKCELNTVMQFLNNACEFKIHVTVSVFSIEHRRESHQVNLIQPLVMWTTPTSNRKLL